MVKRLLGVCVCLCFAAGTLRAQSEDRQLVETARQTLKTYDKAIILISAVVKIDIGSRGSSHEQKTQCVGAIIDPCGLAVTSLTNLNPESLFKLRFSRLGGTQIDFECRVQAVKYRLTDGTEVPARIVLKDEDLDLAFLAPIKPPDGQIQAKMAAIPLDKAAASVEVLEPTILVARSSAGLNYAPTLGLGRIAAVLAKPRTCYLSDGGTLGLPVFNREGKIMGLFCRCISAEGGDSSNLSELTSNLLATSRLILPAADIAKLVSEAKAEMKKPAEAEKK
ncbi:MAG: serine protease [Thermoguttaceae bacterium]